MNDKLHEFILFLLLMSFSFMSDNSNKNNLYTYNDNGRIIVPISNEISKLPEDGGELWNRLIFESSPYLLQHAANPVNWYPWGKDAFELAKRLNKPIFLSIGYTTCHWCHVMEHESFEDDAVAQLMNDTFINIKVDREERPDIDNVYMEVTQELTGRGGWPMTVIMTPDKNPFFAGTYFPKNSRPRYNRPGMLDLVPQIKDLWITKNDSLIANANTIVKSLQSKHINNSKNQILKKTILKDSFNSFNRRFDKTYGGFSGSRNKFPKPHDYSFLAKYYLKTKDNQALSIVNKSLYEMKKGGIYDQIGFGFHRYSTDEKWLVPHFEKMLYDQAMLVHAYLDAYQINQDSYFKDTIIEVCEYVLRDMTDIHGGFYSAEDADSEGEEGVFYIWDSSELKNILSKDEYLFISEAWNIKDSGNSVVEGHRVNIPHFTKDIEKLISDSKIDEIEYKRKYHLIRKKIFNHRENRVHPQKDDKILTDWNGLMISALARASVILDREDYLIAAKKSADFIIENLIDDEGVLLKRHRNGISGIDGMIEDYAFFIWGLTELYQADFNIKYIGLAAKLSDYQIEHFWDFKDKGFYFTSDLSEELIVRSKEVYDGAIPSGNSVSAYNFIRLSRILSRYDYEEIAIGITEAFTSNLNRYGSGSTMLLQAIDFIEGPSYEVIIVGDENKSKNIISELQKNNQPNKVLIYKNSSNEIFNYLDLYRSGDKNEPLVYVCQNYSCKLPTNDIKKINSMLNNY
jgi:uncharacterized protein YyaL (SSP411 family)